MLAGAWPSFNSCQPWLGDVAVRVPGWFPDREGAERRTDGVGGRPPTCHHLFLPCNLGYKSSSLGDPIQLALTATASEEKHPSLQSGAPEKILWKSPRKGKEGFLLQKQLSGLPHLPQKDLPGTVHTEPRRWKIPLTFPTAALRRHVLLLRVSIPPRRGQVKKGRPARDLEGQRLGAVPPTANSRLTTVPLRKTH